MNRRHAPADPAAVPAGWTRVRVIEPSASGFIHIAASSGHWRFPWPPARRRRDPLLTLLQDAAEALRRDPMVVRADVFDALLRPPGRRRTAAGVQNADFDAVLLVETVTVDAAEALADGPNLTGLSDELEKQAARALAFVASNTRRIGPVNHDRQGAFLFNYFSAANVDANLSAWQYTAGWFQDETGLDNSTVLQPLHPDTVPFTMVNHCRWDRLTDVLPALLLKRSFRSFVLKVFDDNNVAPRPLLYRLHQLR